jgi:hypothetical protein
VRGALSNERPYRDSMRVLRILTDPEPTSVLQGTNWPVAKSWAYPPDWSRLS